MRGPVLRDLRIVERVERVIVARLGVHPEDVLPFATLSGDLGASAEDFRMIAQALEPARVQDGGAASLAGRILAGRHIDEVTVEHVVDAVAPSDDKPGSIGIRRDRRGGPDVVGPMMPSPRMVSAARTYALP